MARIETDPNYSSPTFSRATAATDIFKKEDVQGVAAALSTHVHDGVHGLVVTTVAPGSITAAGLAANAVSQRGFATTSSGSTTSTSLSDIPGLSVTLTTTGGDIIATAAISLLPSLAASDAYIAFNLDGTDVTIAAVRAPGAGAPTQASLVYRWSAPAAGAHTVKARYLIIGGGTLNINTNVTSTMLVEEMKR